MAGKNAGATVDKPVLGMDSMVEGPADRALTPTSDAAVTVNRVFTDAPEFTGEDIQTPRLRLAQGISQEVANGMARPGQWIVTGHDPEDFVDLIPTMYSKSREMKDKDDFKIVLCYSPDTKSGVGNPGGDCATCPMKNWGPPRTPGGKGTPPACGIVYSYVGWSVQHQQLVSLELRGASAKAASIINALWQVRKTGKFAVRLDHEVVKGASGPYQTVKASSITVDQSQYEAALLGAAVEADFEEGEV